MGVKTLKDPLVWIDCEMTGLDVERDASSRWPSSSPMAI